MNNTLATALFSDPTEIFIFFAALIGFIFYISEKKYVKKIFDVLPFVFWIYFLPMLSTTIGITPDSSPLYKWISRYILPTSLILLFLSANIPAIMKLGPKALITMLTGSFGIVIGAPIVYFFMRSLFPPLTWKGIGALAGSWIGGSANMTAIKESLNTPMDIFTPLTIVDVIVGYGWMAIVVALSIFQQRFDKWNKADTTLLAEVNERMRKIELSRSKPFITSKLLVMIGLSFAIALLCIKVGYAVGGYIEKAIPQISYIFTSFTIVVILVTIIGIILSFTKWSELEDYGASKVGYGMFYILLASIGAQANLVQIVKAPRYIILGLIWLSIHVLCLFLLIRIFKIPMFFAATASQANIGGPVSAPIVAAVYQPSLAVVGLLMAILGNILGTFLGLFTAYICSLLAVG